jgi:hypothetical protein
VTDDVKSLLLLLARCQVQFRLEAVAVERGFQIHYLEHFLL